jgi:hypothetical protein
VRKQRRDFAAEHAIEQTAAFMRLPLFARQHGRIEIAPAFPFGAHRTLAD